MAYASGGQHELGWHAAGFELEGVDGRPHKLAELKGEKGTLVMFICNHCPYVKGVIDGVVEDCKALAAEGVNAVAIMSNDTDAYPADSFDKMKEFARAHGFGFSYLIDRTQAVARAYGAVCTPDIYGFDAGLALRYRGRVQEMRGSSPVKGAKREMLEAMRLIARTGKGPAEQVPAIGCSIKWRS
ncbi:MAG TPA: thioredoxin family protein [Hypericibacter adhaerens]|jgi:peroxiredoxin|uniref:Thioredoxin family protein n=1 Tax=Hypericibacter adhaerens TaxID=2602016 RepID=A0A5J6MVL5_9PROT|nr:thioredoxin family protein [Hypericibacter adhaerens]QEX21692.1 thioredoxin family protein [Hypericibacter adhaerens]HWA42504.1 thioredoxin family protein [Hypericibacter adhaerens]